MLISDIFTWRNIVQPKHCDHNFYVYILSYLNWPVRDYIKEYDIDLTEPQPESAEPKDEAVAP